MRKSLLVAAALSLVAAVGQGAAGAAPTSKIAVTCAVGGTTVVSWQRARVVNVVLAWSGPAGAVYRGVSSAVAPHPPHGTLTVATPVDTTAGIQPASVTATLTLESGGAPEVAAVGCT